jgi:hypothetical protein
LAYHSIIWRIEKEQGHLMRVPLVLSMGITLLYSQHRTPHQYTSHKKLVRGFSPPPLGPYYSLDASSQMEASEHVRDPASLSLEKETLLDINE